MKNPKEITLMVVDDEEPLRRLMAFDLERQGYRVLEAANGKSAFELLKGNKVDLVLTDIRMPGGDGIELLNNIRNVNPEIPAVFLITGFADLSLEDAYNAGANAFFTKPFNRAELLAKIIKAVSARDETWSLQAERSQDDFEIGLQFPDFKSAITAHTLGLGRGGMFVGLDKQFPRTGQIVHFHFQFSNGTPRIIEGDGLVRWIRSQTSPDLPAGCGIEFIYLSDQTREDLIGLIRSMPAKAYIPKN